MQNFRSPVTILSLLGGVLLIVGGLMDWVVVPADSLAGLVAGEIESLVGTKSTITVVMGAAILLLTYLAASKKKKIFVIFNIFASIVALMTIMTANIPADDAALMGLSGMEPGYWAAVVGMILAFVGAVGGFKLCKAK
jgi:hypothetical protein